MKKIKIKWSNSEKDEMERDADFTKLDENGEPLESTEEDASLEETKDELSGDESTATQDSSVSDDQKDLEIRELREKYLRALADLENFKKRALKERSENLKYQGEKVFADILEVSDNLERALEHLDATPEQQREGVELILKSLIQVYDRWGVRAVDSAGKAFDPNQHNALSRVPTADHPPGTVINELKKAYFYKDKLLRPAEVVVSALPEGDQKEAHEAGEQESLDPGEEGQNSNN